MRPCLLLALSLGLAACGGAEPAPARTPLPEAPAEPSWGERALAAFEGGDLDRAKFASSNALQLDAADTTAQEVAVRVALAENDLDRATSVLGEPSTATLVRLQARTLIARGDFAGAARVLGEIADAEPRDPWADALLPLCRAAADAPALFAIEGPERVQLPLIEAPLPIVAVTIDGRTAQALIATSIDIVLVNQSLRAEPGVIESLAFGDLVVRGVPSLSKDLTPIGGQLQTHVDVVIGLDLLLRLRATLHGPERWLSLRRTGTDATAEARSMPFVTFGGSVLAVRAAIGDDVVGYFSYDTAGLFPVALSNAVVQQMHLTDEQLEEIPGAPAGDVRMTTIAMLTAGDIALEQVPAVTGLIPEDNAERLGAPLIGSFGAQLAMAMKTTFDPEERVLRVE